MIRLRNILRLSNERMNKIEDPTLQTSARICVKVSKEREFRRTNLFVNIQSNRTKITRLKFQESSSFRLKKNAGDDERIVERSVETRILSTERNVQHVERHFKRFAQIKRIIALPTISTIPNSYLHFPTINQRVIQKCGVFDSFEGRCTAAFPWFHAEPRIS